MSSSHALVAIAGYGESEQKKSKGGEKAVETDEAGKNAIVCDVGHCKAPQKMIKHVLKFFFSSVVGRKGVRVSTNLVPTTRPTRGRRTEVTIAADDAATLKRGWGWYETCVLLPFVQQSGESTQDTYRDASPGTLKCVMLFPC